jgi:polyphosphate kinase 2 (PPK2 family)
MKCLPNRGHIGIFNRSYYEEVLVVRVHPEFMAKQKLPPKLVGKKIWEERFEDIRNFEQYLARNGVVVQNSFCTFQKRNRNDDFSIASTTRRKTGSSRLMTPMSATIGTITWKLMKK